MMTVTKRIILIVIVDIVTTRYSKVSWKKKWTGLKYTHADLRREIMRMLNLKGSQVMPVIFTEKVKCCETKSINQSIQFWSGFIPINGGGQIYPTLTAISPTPTFHLAQFMTFSFSKWTLLLSFSTCVFHVFFGCPRFLLPFTSNSKAYLKTYPSKKKKKKKKITFPSNKNNKIERHHPSLTHSCTISFHLCQLIVGSLKATNFKKSNIFFLFLWKECWNEISNLSR